MPLDNKELDKIFSDDAQPETPKKTESPDLDSIFDVRPKRTVAGTVKDIGISALKGGAGLVESVQGIADLPTGGQFGKFTEEIGYKPRAIQEYLADEYSPAQKAANKKVEEAEGFVGKVGAAIKNPSTIAHTTVESLPLMVGGQGIARGLIKGAPKIFAKTEGRKLAASAAGEGIISAGGSAEGIRQETETGTLTPGQSAMAIASGVGTGIFSLVGGKIADKFGFADPDTFLAGIKGKGKASESLIDVGKKIIAGGISEGVFEELPQSIQETVWTNAALDRPLTEGVDEAAAMGMLSGAAMGGGVNLIQSRKRPAAIDAPPAPAAPAPAPAAPPPPSGPISGALNKAPLAQQPEQEAGTISKAVGTSPEVADRESTLLQIQQNLDEFAARATGRPSTAEEAAGVFFGGDVNQHNQERDQRQQDLEETFSQYFEKEEQRLREIELARQAGYITDEEAIAFEDQVKLERQKWAEKNRREGLNKAWEQTIKEVEAEEAAAESDLSGVKFEFLVEAKKEAEEIVRENPSYQQMAEAKSRGGLSLPRAKEFFSDATINALNKKYPGLFTNYATALNNNIDEYAHEQGFDSADAMVNKWLTAPTIQSEAAKIARQRKDEWDRYDDLQKENEEKDNELDPWDQAIIDQEQADANNETDTDNIQPTEPITAAGQETDTGMEGDKDLPGPPDTGQPGTVEADRQGTGNIAGEPGKEEQARDDGQAGTTAAIQRGSEKGIPGEIADDDRGDTTGQSETDNIPVLEPDTQGRDADNDGTEHVLPVGVGGTENATGSRVVDDEKKAGSTEAQIKGLSDDDISSIFDEVDQERSSDKVDTPKAAENKTGLSDDQYAAFVETELPVDPGELKGRDSKIYNEKLPKNKKAALAKLNKARKSYAEALEKDKERYSELIEKGNGAVSDYDLAFDYDAVFNLNLKSAHITANNQAIKDIDELIAGLEKPTEDKDTFAGGRKNEDGTYEFSQYDKDRIENYNTDSPPGGLYNALESKKKQIKTAERKLEKGVKRGGAKLTPGEIIRTENVVALNREIIKKIEAALDKKWKSGEFDPPENWKTDQEVSKQYNKLIGGVAGLTEHADRVEHIEEVLTTRPAQETTKATEEDKDLNELKDFSEMKKEADPERLALYEELLPEIQEFDKKALEFLSEYDKMFEERIDKLNKEYSGVNEELAHHELPASVTNIVSHRSTYTAYVFKRNEIIQRLLKPKTKHKYNSTEALKKSWEKQRNLLYVRISKWENVINGKLTEKQQRLRTEVTTLFDEVPEPLSDKRKGLEITNPINGQTLTNARKGLIAPESEAKTDKFSNVFGTKKFRAVIALKRTTAGIPDYWVALAIQDDNGFPLDDMQVSGIGITPQKALEELSLTLESNADAIIERNRNDFTEADLKNKKNWEVRAIAQLNRVEKWRTKQLETLRKEILAGQKQLDLLKPKDTTPLSGVTQKIRKQETPTEDVIKGGVASSVYRSGSTASNDFAGNVEAGVPSGTVIHRITPEVVRMIVEQAKKGIKTFVDSGAFGKFKEGKEFTSQDVKRIMGLYADLVEKTDGNVTIVGPDVVGSQAKTLRFIEDNAAELKSFIDKGVDLILPAQKGDLSHTNVVRVYGNLLGTTNFRVGIPSNAEALTIKETKEIIETGHKKIHFLGLTPSTRLKTGKAKLKMLAQYPDVDFSMDANRILAKVGKKRPITKFQKNPPLEAKLKAIQQLNTADVDEYFQENIDELRTLITDSGDTELLDIIEAAAEDDVSYSMLQDVIAERLFNTEGTEAEEQAKKGSVRTSAVSSTVDEYEGEKTAASIIKKGGIGANTAVKQAMTGLSKLFGDPNTLGSGPVFDEETYAKAKPHFIEAWNGVKEVGHSVKELINYFYDQFGASIRPYLERFVKDVRDGNIDDDLNRQGDDDTIKEKGEENVNNERGNTDLERDSETPEPENEMGKEGVQDEPGTDSGAGEPGVQRNDRPEATAPSSGSGAGPETATPGKRGDISPYSNDEQHKPERSTSRGDDDNGGFEPGFGGKPTDSFSPEESSRTAQKRNDLAAKAKAQKDAEKIPVKIKDRENISQTLPYLHEGQQDDVAFAERRFDKDKGYGVLFTNGTGTGKTFTGLGVAKRFARQGKSNILILAPSDKIANDWITSGKALGLDISLLENIRDNGGKKIVVTTYANAGQNDSLAHREWDLVIPDEAHYLKQSADGKDTLAIKTVRAITNHPRGSFERYQMLNRKDIEHVEQLNNSIKSNTKIMNNPDTMDQMYFDLKERNKKLEAQAKELQKKLDIERGKVEKQVAEAQGKGRTRALFLSATPFAYEKTVDWADGFLFDYPQVKQEDSYSYNAGDGYQRFMIEKFGYRMRYNKLTEPGPEVDRGLMQRQFNADLKKSKVLSGRMLDVDADYDRRFILTKSAVGAKIDEGMEFLWENKKYRELSAKLLDAFDHLTRRYLLESIKAKEVIPIIKEHLALGRKVVVFHDFKKGGGFNPFDFSAYHDSTSEIEVEVGDKDFQTMRLKDLVADFEAERPDLVNLPLKSLRSPLVQLGEAFPEAVIFNGSVSKKERRRIVDEFQKDGSEKNLFVVQSAAGREGISLHDTTGNHQRVLINLGLPTQPTTSIQQEGRIYRVGQVSNAIQRYLNTGTNWERIAFATTIAQRTSAAENLALGEQARALRDAFIEAYEESDTYPAGHEGEGTGGKERDRAANSAITLWDRAMTLYFAQQKNSKRRDQREGKDYFATPEPLGLKMVEWGDIRDGDKAAEPSAGHGAIARWFPENNDRTVIEPSPELSSRLKMVTDAQLIQGNFEDHHIVNKYDVIVMNPPFGNGGSLAIPHLDKATKHLKEGGRVVALIPTGPAADKRFDKWFYEEDKKGNLVRPELHMVAIVGLPRITFARAGTMAASRIVIIDKVSDQEQAGQIQQVRRSYDQKDAKEFFQAIEHAEFAKRQLKVAPRAQEQRAEKDSNKPAYELTKGYHTKNKHDIWTVKVKKSLDRDAYTEVRDIAKKHGGYYSRFAKGFIFDEESGANKFVAAAFGETGNKTYEAAAKYDIVEEGGHRYNIPKTEEPTQTSMFVPESGQVPAGSTGARKKFLEAYPAKIGTFKIDLEKIENVEEAAHVLHPLGMRAQETFMALVLDADNKPLSVIQHSIGGPRSNQIFIPEFLGSIHNIKGAKSVWIAHNHPSSSLEGSPADIKLTGILQNANKKTGVDFLGHLIITPAGKAAALTMEDGTKKRSDFTIKKPAANTNTVKVTERRLRGDEPELLDTSPIQSSVEAKEAIKEHARGQNGILLLNTQHQPISFIPATLADMMAMREGKGRLAAKLFRAFDKKNNATNAILNFSGETLKHRAAETNFVKFANAIGVNLLDSFVAGNSQATYGTLEQTKNSAGSEYQSQTEEAGDIADIKTELFKEKGKVMNGLVEESSIKIVTPEQAESMLGKQYNSGTQAFVKNKVVYLVQGVIRKGRVFDLMLHEMSTHINKLNKSDKVYRKIKASLRLRKDNDTAAGKAIRAAMARVPEGTEQSKYWDEVLAYLIEDAPRMNMVRRFIARVKEMLMDYVNPKFVNILTNEDLKVIAIRSLAKNTQGNTTGGILRSQLEKAKRAILNQAAFKKWFEGSKVVDENGEPLVVYHGTAPPNSEFMAFEIGEKYGAFFSDNPKVSESYAEIGGEQEFYRKIGRREYRGMTYPVYLAMKKPLVIEGTGTRWDEIPMRIVPPELGIRIKNHGLTDTDDIVKAAKELGKYDGVIFKNIDDSAKLGIDSNIYVTFQPTQIKSVFNRKWDGRNPDILRSVAQFFKPVTRDVLKSYNFKQWFGGSVLKNKDTNQPYVFYHGSNDSFTEFDLEKAGRNTGHTSSGLGFFFGTKKKMAAKYGQNVSKVFLRMENPYRMTMEESQSFESLEKAKQRREELASQGYDGIVMDFSDVGGDPYIVVFDPNQIKSAETNTGEFSRDQDDIRLSVVSDTINTPSGVFNVETRTGIDAFTEPFTSAWSYLKDAALKIMPEDKRENLITYLADKDAAISRVQKEVSVGRESEDYSLARRLEGKKTADEIQEFERLQLQPLLKHMADSDVSFAEVHDLAWAEHAPERNLQMKRVNARRYIDNFMQFLTDKQKGKYLEKLGDIQDEFVMEEQERNERRDNYIALMEQLGLETNQRQEEVDKRQRDLDQRKFTPKEIEKGTPEFLQERINNEKERIEKQREISAVWDDVKDRLSGLTNDQAAGMERVARAKGNYTHLKTAVNRLRAINEAALDMNYKAGEFTEEEYNAIKNTYEYHVPLMRDGMDQDGKTATGKKGIGPLGKPLKIAAGSTKGVVNIFGNIVDRYQSAISRKHKLESGKILYNMVKNNPDDSRWSIGEQEKAPHHDNEGNIRYHVDFQLPDNEVYVKVDGKKYIIHVPNDNKSMLRWMEALKRQPANLGPFIRGSQVVSRFLARLNTSYSPEFLITNFTRDIQTAGIHLEDTEAKGMQKQVLKGLPKAIKAIFLSEQEKDAGSWGRVYRDFAKNGGKIGWMQGYENTEELAKNLEKELAMEKGEKPVRANFRKLTRFIGSLNMAVENGVRLATYKALIDSGVVSKKRAAHIVSNLTVDFTRHGSAGPAMNSLWMFANAGIQGNLRVLRALKNKKVQKIAGGIFGLGFSLNIIGAYGGGDDDDGESYYDKLLRTNPSLFERNMIFMIPGGEGKYIKIPMPYGYNTILASGGEAASAFRGGPGYSYIDGMARISSVFMNTLNPLGSATLLQTLSPTVTDPIVQVFENKSWHGGALMPEKNPFGIPTPDSERYFASVNPGAKFATRWINNITGGSQVKPGLIDVSPETIEMIFETATGSMGRIAKDTVSLAASPFTDQKIESHKVPFFRKVAGFKSDYTDRAIYKQNRDKVLQIKEEFDIADRREKATIRRDPLFRLAGRVKQSEKKLRKMRKRYNLAKERGSKRLIEKIETAMSAEYVKFNTIYNKALSTYG